MTLSKEFYKEALNYYKQGAGSFITHLAYTQRLEQTPPFDKLVYSLLDIKYSQESYATTPQLEQDIQDITNHLTLINLARQYNAINNNNNPTPPQPPNPTPPTNPTPPPSPPTPTPTPPTPTPTATTTATPPLPTATTTGDYTNTPTNSAPQNIAPEPKTSLENTYSQSVPLRSMTDISSLNTVGESPGNSMKHTQKMSFFEVESDSESSVKSESDSQFSSNSNTMSEPPTTPGTTENNSSTTANNEDLELELELDLDIDIEEEGEESPTPPTIESLYPTPVTDNRTTETLMVPVTTLNIKLKNKQFPLHLVMKQPGMSADLLQTLGVSESGVYIFPEIQPIKNIKVFDGLLKKTGQENLIDNILDYYQTPTNNDVEYRLLTTYLQGA